MTWVPGEALLIRWSETLERLGAGIMSPHQIKREGLAHAEARRMERLLDAQTDRDVEDIRNGRKLLGADAKLISHHQDNAGPTSEDIGERREPLLIAPKTPVELIQQAEQHATIEQTKRYLNLRAIAHLTEEALNKDVASPESGASVDADWLARWKDGASDISDEQMRTLWAKLLAGEVSTPGRYSLRTVNLLRNLTKSDAEKISKLAPFAIDDFVAKDHAGIFDEAGLNFDAFLELEEIGVINGVQGLISTNVRLLKQDGGHCGSILKTYGKRALMFRSDKEGMSFTLPCYNITGVGREILSIGTFVPNERYLIAIAESLKGKGFEIGLGDWIRVAPGITALKNPTWFK